MRLLYRRLVKDKAALREAGYKVKVRKQDASPALCVMFPTPDDSMYKGQILEITFTFPVNYPYDSPSVAFPPCSIFHPNVEFRTGSICMTLWGSEWKPSYQLASMLKMGLTQILRYPNYKDPHNKEATCLYYDCRKKNNMEPLHRQIRETYKAYQESLEAQKRAHAEISGHSSSSTASTAVSSQACPTEGASGRSQGQDAAASTPQSHPPNDARNPQEPDHDSSSWKRQRVG